MDIKEIETYLLTEISNDNPEAWIHQLAYARVLDRKRTTQLLDRLQLWVVHCQQAGKTKRDNPLVSNAIAHLSYAMFLFFCHLNPDDLYRIKRIRKNDVLVGLHLQMRSLIQALSSL